MKEYIKGYSQLWDRADLDTSFLALKRVYLNPKSKIRVEYISKSVSIFPVFYSIFYPLLYYFAFGFAFAHPMVLFSVFCARVL